MLSLLRPIFWREFIFIITQRYFLSLPNEVLFYQKKTASKQKLPIGHESVILAAKHCSNVGSMVDRWVEVRVVANSCGEMHGDVILWD